MKTLLLILGVVAFVYLDSGYSMECYACKGLVALPEICPTVQCEAGLDQCSVNKTQTMMGPVYKRGCTTNCTNNTTTYCCSADRCNSIYMRSMG